MAKSNLRDAIIVMARNGDRLSHRLKIVKVETRNADGTPRQVTILHCWVDFHG